MHEERKFQDVPVNGIVLRTVVEGDGPLVILLHGWPQGWNFWRNQIDPLVAAGYRVAVPDMRGYGGSSKPEEVDEYNILKLTSDIPALAKALGHDTFQLVGHDWGCIVAWNTALLNEDTCTAVMGLSVPFWYPDETIIDPPGADDKFWFMRYLQDPEVADTFMDANAREFLQKVYYCLSNDAPHLSFMKQFEYGRDANIVDFLPKTSELPKCISEEEFEYNLAQFMEGGFRGPNNYYRNLLQHRALAPQLDGKKFSQPAAFLYGENDDVPEFQPGWEEGFRAAFEDLRFIEVVPNAAHWVQLEQPEETTKHILRFLRETS
tara:strand:- start:18004 stop:18963 length:960 start_codon:yes stop_codon:yes gene_type:complete